MVTMPRGVFPNMYYSDGPSMQPGGIINIIIRGCFTLRCTRTCGVTVVTCCG